MILLNRKKPSSAAFRAGFTLVELMVAGSISVIVMGSIMAFSKFALASFSGITKQSTLNQRAGYAIELIQIRTLKASRIQIDSTGNILTLGFDDNYTVDSDGDGTPYNDSDHSERFQFLGKNSTNFAACLTNRLIYIPNITKTNNKVLVPSGLRDLPGSKLFRVTNDNMVVIRFGIADSTTLDHYQSIDIQGTSVALNRPSSATNFILIKP